MNGRGRRFNPGAVCLQFPQPNIPKRDAGSVKLQSNMPGAGCFGAQRPVENLDGIERGLH